MVLSLSSFSVLHFFLNWNLNPAQEMLDLKFWGWVSVSSCHCLSVSPSLHAAFCLFPRLRFPPSTDCLRCRFLVCWTSSFCLLLIPSWPSCLGPIVFILPNLPQNISLFSHKTEKLLSKEFSTFFSKTRLQSPQTNLTLSAVASLT